MVAFHLFHNAGGGGGGGGRATDKFITMHTGLLNLLEHGDAVLTVRGFDTW